MKPMAPINDGNLRPEIGIRHGAARGTTNLVDGNIQGQNHGEERSAKKQKVETKADWRACSSCRKEKQPNDFDDWRKTCRACLSSHRLGREKVSGILSHAFL